MLASQNLVTGMDPRPMNDFVESQLFPGYNRNENSFYIPCDFREEISWAEQKFQAGEYTALVAIYDNVPPDLKNSLDSSCISGGKGFCKN